MPTLIVILGILIGVLVSAHDEGWIYLAPLDARLASEADASAKFEAVPKKESARRPEEVTVFGFTPTQAVVVAAGLLVAGILGIVAMMRGAETTFIDSDRHPQGKSGGTSPNGSSFPTKRKNTGTIYDE